MTLVISVFLLTYSGRIESSDTRAMLDAISSQVYFGDSLLDQSAFYTFPPPESNTGPLASIDVEPLQLILATPLFWLASIVPGFGLAHTVWLFNLFVSAGACALLYLYALRLSYSRSVAVAVSLSLAFCTILWPYSKTFFREPLALLLILMSGYALETARQSASFRLVWVIVATLASAGALLTKEAIIFAIPALALIALPRRVPTWIWSGLSVALFLPVLALIALTLISTFADSSTLIQSFHQWLSALTGRPLNQVSVFLPALHTYLLSIGGSIWGTSPIVLMALPGAVMYWRMGQRRYMAVACAMLLGFAVGYGLFRGLDWFGGLSWPSRFLLPVLPYLLLLTLPTWEHLLHRPGRLARWGVGVLLAYSVWIQFSAVSLPWEQYTTALPPESGTLGEWGGGLNTLQYLRWFVIPALWADQQLDFAWLRVYSPGWALLALSLVVISAAQLRALPGLKPRSSLPYTTLVFPVALLVVIGLGLRSIYFDPYYLGDRSNLHAFLPEIQSSTESGDVVMLANEHYALFFLNYGKMAYPRIVTLSDHPGESPSPEQAARVQSILPDRLLAQITPPMIHKLAVEHERLWVLSDASEWLPWRVRPVERFMAYRYYPLQERSTIPPDPEIRLIEFSTILAPDPAGFRGPDDLLSMQFGDRIRLRGVTLPHGVRYQPGVILPVTFHWVSAAPVDRSYTVAWFLVNSSKSVVLQGVDTVPGWGFHPTTTWQPGQLVLDNRALRLPLDAQPGEYQLWLRLYESGDSSNLLPVQGADGDGFTAVLSIPIFIENTARP